MSTPPYHHALCIDPGASGAANLVALESGQPVLLHAFKDGARAAKFVEHCVNEAVLLPVVIEAVHATPVMAVSSAFAFGRNYGLWLGLAASWDLPAWAVSPQEWQKVLNIPTGTQGPDRKRCLCNMAKIHFADISKEITLSTCDAALLGHVAHRYWANEKRLPGKILDL